MLRRRACPGTGTLRRLLDSDEAAVAPELREHVSQCPACQRLVDELEQSAEIARRVVASAGPPAVPEAALAYRRWQQYQRGSWVRRDRRQEGGI